MTAWEKIIVVSEMPLLAKQQKISKSSNTPFGGIFSQSQTMCIQVVTQVVTQVFAKLCKNNHHTNFQLITKKYVQKTDTNFTTTVLSFSVLVCNQYFNTIILSGVFLDVQLFLDIHGRTIIRGYSWAYNYSCEAARIRRKEENHQILVLWVYFCMVYFLYF